MKANKRRITASFKELLHKELSYKVQGCFYDIRNEYGPGQKEIVYSNLLAEKLVFKEISFKREQSIKIYSSDTGKVVGTYKPDFVVDNKLIVEVKSSMLTTKIDEKQLYYYLRNSRYEVGYLVNFSTPHLHIKRIVYSNERKPFLKGLA